MRLNYFVFQKFTLTSSHTKTPVSDVRLTGQMWDSLNEQQILNSGLRLEDLSDQSSVRMMIMEEKKKKKQHMSPSSNPLIPVVMSVYTAVRLSV